jgi:mono/diheme cytochrome c family protein
MSTFLFVLLFVVLGLGTVLVAMRSGRSGPVFDPNKRSGRRAVAWLTALIVLVFGVAVPVATGIDNSDTTKEAESVELSAAAERGRKLFSPTCAQCHTLKASKAVGRVGPNLDVIRPPAKLVEDAILNGRYRGRGQMPDRLYEGRDATDVAAYVAAVAGR